MVKKRSHRQISGKPFVKKRRKAKSEHLDNQIMLVDSLLEFLASQGDPVSMGEILVGMDLPRHARSPLKTILSSLEKKGKVQHLKQKYLLVGDSGLLKAVLDMNRKGFGFAIVEGADKKDKDPFISHANLGGASHRDTILFRVTRISRGRPEARVVKVLQRGITRICGLYTSGGKIGYVTPDNERLPYTVLIRKNNNLGARNDTAVLVEIIDYGSGGRSPEGKIVEILGDPLTAPVQIRMAIEQFELPTAFPAKVEQEALQLEPLTQCESQRMDLRHICHVTIDGETAKDFDDAIAVENTKTGYRLYVSIADVSHYVKVGTAIDMEAYRRGTSTYFPDRVIPMLPERLSNNLCSLVPNEDRPAFTTILEFNKNGIRTGEKFCKSMITSRQRFTYTTVRKILYDRDLDEQKTYRPLLPMLESARNLAEKLLKRRKKRGSIGFNLPEAVILLQDDKIEAIKRAERNQAHQLIEEFMLAANEAVAETMAKKKQAILYRIHEQPDPEKVEQFTEAITLMGIQFQRMELSPSWFAKVIEEAENSPKEYVVNNLMLRTMQQARYSPENAGHFGLAAEYYLHFTSPIRRYPDLVAHRVLHNLLSLNDPEPKKIPILTDKATLADAALHLSKRERVSVDVERNIQSRLSALFLMDHIGEEFDAIISGATSFGLFVELLETFISGGIPVREMKDDYYIYDSKAHRLIGEESMKTYQMGDLIRVRLDHVDMISKKNTFTLTE